MKTRGPVKRPIDVTVDEAMEAVGATDRALRHWMRALADGVITIDEAHEGVRLIEVALAESRDVVRVAEHANEIQKLGLQFAMYGECTPHAISNARTIGIDAPVYDDAAD